MTSDSIQKYFQAERSESILFAFIGILAIALAIYFFFSIRTAFHTGIGIAFIAIACIQIIVGITVYLRSPHDTARVQDFVRNDTEKIRSEEIPRMETVNNKFLIYRWIEIVLIIIGVVLSFNHSIPAIWRGFGFGLALQACFMLNLDFFAERRGARYLDFLRSIIQ